MALIRPIASNTPTYLTETFTDVVPGNTAQTKTFTHTVQGTIISAGIISTTYESTSAGIASGCSCSFTDGIITVTGGSGVINQCTITTRVVYI